ncbi:MAG: DUF2460 domain-containing protein [Robiginitomaculum sp.]|nr:DUF2460 domain-containing protein [Robiginitomaculum sp.]
MPAFHNVSFPLPLAFGASGGPQRQTEIVTLASGHEQRNTSQFSSRRRYDAGIGVKSLADVQLLIAFFEARRGQYHGFRFRDPIDYSSALGKDPVSNVDQVLGVGDGVQSDWQLRKVYGDMEGSWHRVISKPIIGSVVIALDGVETNTAQIDHGTGIVSLSTPPANGVIITAGFEFDVPVRFDADSLNTSLESFGAGGVVHIPLVEIRIHA